MIEQALNELAGGDEGLRRTLASLFVGWRGRNVATVASARLTISPEMLTRRERGAWEADARHRLHHVLAERPDGITVHQPIRWWAHTRFGAPVPDESTADLADLDGYHLIPPRDLPYRARQLGPGDLLVVEARARQIPDLPPGRYDHVHYRPADGSATREEFHQR